MSSRGLRCGLTIVIVLLALHPVGAQETSQAERDAMYHRYLAFASYVKGGFVEPHWMADGNSFWYAEHGPDETVSWKVDPVANTKQRLFDVNVPAPAASRADMPRRSASLGVASPDGRRIATVRNYNVWLRSTVDDTEIQLTSDGVKDHEWWLAAPALSGQDRAAWSPDGFILAAKKVDYRHVPQIPLVDWLGPIEQVELAPFPRKPGQPIDRAELFLLDVRSGKQVRVHTGEEPDRRIFLLGWLPDGSNLLFLRMRDSDASVALVAADPITGATRVVLTEEQRPVPFRTTGPQPGETPFISLEDGRRFLWMSRRTGRRHLYLYDVAGHLVRPLTHGEITVDRVVRVDEATGWIYYTARANAQRPYDTHLYRGSLGGEGSTRLTDAPGQHHIQFAPSGRFFLDTHSSVDRPPVVELRRADGKLLRTLAAADIDDLGQLQWHPPEEFVVNAADGSADLHGVLYKPFDFDPKRKYAVILETGGVQRAFAGNGWIQAMAQLGFVTFRVDVREPLHLLSRGGEFDRVTAGTMGRYEIPDYVAALQGLASERPYMDLSRVGIYGQSYGGYHSIRAMLQAPDVFHVGIAVAAIADSYGHPNFYVLGSPEGNDQAFEESSNLSLAGNLKGKLLLVHGTHDVSVPFSHAMKMVDALTRAGKPYDLIILPGWGHWYPDTELWARYRSEAYRRYFVEHLRPQ